MAPGGGHDPRGTDANQATSAPASPPYSTSLHHELGLLVDAGLSAFEALRSATALAAQQFGLADRRVIAPGKRADLVLIDGDPAQDIDAIASISAVWCGGVPVAFGAMTEFPRSRNRRTTHTAHTRRPSDRRKKCRHEARWDGPYKRHKHRNIGWNHRFFSRRGGRCPRYALTWVRDPDGRGGDAGEDGGNAHRPASLRLLIVCQAHVTVSPSHSGGVKGGKTPSATPPCLARVVTRPAADKYVV